MKRACLFSLAVGVILALASLTTFSQTAPPTWQPNTAYAVNARVTFNGAQFQCLQAHTSQVGWEPPNVPALWTPLSGTPAPTPTPSPAPTPTPTPPPTGSCSAAAWSATQIYTGGMTASVNGVVYRANWWTQGQNPTTNNGPAGSGQPWTNIGTCVPGPAPTPTPTPPPPPPPLPPGARLFAPYIDMSLTADQQLLTIQQQSGIRVFTLAFIVGNGGCTPTWGGLGPISNDMLPNGTTMLSLVNGVRSAGGDVIISFGGAAGAELALGCSTPASLQAAYQAVINRYHVNKLDFDIEGGAALDQASVDRRSAALRALAAANPGLQISLTLPVLPTGLVDSGVNVVANAVSNRTPVAVVNIMAMDYGSSFNPNAMGQHAINAANATLGQMRTAGMSARLGVTVMIGSNDVQPEVFTLADARNLLAFAQSNTSIALLSMWSVARDNGTCANAGFASPVCSGIAQNPFDFAKVFEAFR